MPTARKAQDLASVFDALNQSLRESIRHYRNASSNAEWLASDLDDHLQGLNTWRIPAAWMNTSASGIVDLSDIHDMIGRTEEARVFGDLVNNMTTAARNDVYIAKPVRLHKVAALCGPAHWDLDERVQLQRMVECLAELSELVEGLLLVATQTGPGIC